MEDNKDNNSPNKLFGDRDFLNDDVNLGIGKDTQKDNIIGDYGFIHQVFKRISDVFEMISTVGASFMGYDKNKNNKK